MFKRRRRRCASWLRRRGRRDTRRVRSSVAVDAVYSGGRASRFDDAKQSVKRKIRPLVGRVAQVSHPLFDTHCRWEATRDRRLHFAAMDCNHFRYCQPKFYFRAVVSDGLEYEPFLWLVRCDGGVVDRLCRGRWAVGCAVETSHGGGSLCHAGESGSSDQHAMLRNCTRTWGGWDQESRTSIA